MEAINYSDFRANMKSYMDNAYENHETMIITRKKMKNIVIMSIEDYNSLMTTNYLLANPNNSKHLLESIEQAKEGRTVSKTVEELELCE
ncbi:type II toxin-antitoxin system Phd/YefM family antitoxin [Haliovirga abyssi]|uniref:Antitoxin n=1 Tax=Haliovirga abyssi TaxID=2996794 RepID=A0AAU9DKE9_9FUSO|nr:type II toxin-antitoxin system prevent-host-death family antitoxin [Haliovirga abyssi]BDU51389.1 type II toxin-antitoxin system Phd/YefM family antitoxin [Haliovirga abyssi]